MFFTLFDIHCKVHTTCTVKVLRQQHVRVGNELDFCSSAQLSSRCGTNMPLAVFEILRAFSCEKPPLPHGLVEKERFRALSDAGIQRPVLLATNMDIYIYIYTALSYERFRRSTLPVTAAAVQQYCCCCCTTQPLYSRSRLLLSCYCTTHSPRVYRQNHGNDMTTQMAYCLTHVGGST